MKVHSLLELLNFSHTSSDNELVIAIKEHIPTLGPTPSVQVENIGVGFDWDSGKVLLYPKEKLTKYKKNDTITELALLFVKEIAQQKTAKGKLTKLAQRAQLILEQGTV